MRSSMFKNLRFQTYFQAINTVIPLVTTPYIARVLGASMIGVFSSAHAMASFFTLFAVFGIGNYGTRCISAENDDEKRKTLFMELYSLQLITCVIASVCYLLYCVLFAENKTIAFLQFITLLGSFFEVSWFYFGIEDFVITVVSSSIFRLISVVLLFVLVKSSDDLVIYTLIMLGSAFMSQIVLWLLIVKKGYFKPGTIRKESVKKHFLPNFKLFIPLVAMTVCTSTDKAMLGSLSTYDQAGYYSNIDRIINVPFSIFSGFGTVFLPRVTSLSLESEKKAKDFFLDTLSGIIMLGVAISFGIIAVADSFIPFFLGSGYEPCVMLIKAFSPVIIIKSISNAIRMHFLVPLKKENIFILATVTGAVLNIVLNFILIPRFGALGAIITTIFSEIVVLAFQIIRTYKFSEIIPSIKDLLVYLCIGGIMIFVSRLIGFESDSAVLKLVFDVVIGAITYCLLTLVYWIVSKNNLYNMYIKKQIIGILDKIARR